MSSWWSLGEGSGYRGTELNVEYITCPFCLEEGLFEVVHHASKKKPNSSKVLNFDTLECANCRGYVMTLWSTGGEVWNYKVLPWPQKRTKYPGHWPDAVGRYWLQAKRNIDDDNWDAAAVMARSALQIAIRDKNIKGKNLKEEIDLFAKDGILPPIMKEWAHSVRLLGNESAHPMPQGEAISASDANDIVRFLDFLMKYLYDLPHEIESFRERQNTAT